MHRLAFDRPARRELKKSREVGKFPGWQLDVNRLRVTERVGLGLPVMRSDREARAFGDGRQCVIGGNAGDPSVVPLRHGRTKANTSRNIEQQPLELPFGLAGCVVFRLAGGNVGRQHGSKRRVFTDHRVYAELCDRADELAEEFDVHAESCARRIGGADEGMCEPGALDDEELGVQMRRQGLVRVFRDIIRREARRRINLVDVQVFERGRGERVELLATRDQHRRPVVLGPENTS